MRLQSITINNYRSFGESCNTVQVNPGVTTIVGMNGSGKSNLIDAISKIDLINGSNTQNWSQDRNRVTALPISITVKLIPLEGEDTGIFGQGVTEISIAEENVYTITGGVPDVFIQRLNNYDVIILKRLQADVPNTGEKAGIISNAGAIKNFSKQPLARSRMQLTKLKSDAEKYIKEDKKTEVLNYISDLLCRLQAIINSIPVIFKHSEGKQLKNSYSFDELRELDSKNRERCLDLKPNDLLLNLIKIAGIKRKDIISAIQSGSPARKNMFEKEANPLLADRVMSKFCQFYKGGKERLNLELRIENNTLNLIFSSGMTSTYFSERSNGLRWYFKMFIDLMNCINGERPIVFIIDEPGIHLHVNAQDELRKLFFQEASHGSQIIYTTHSPYMIDPNLGCLRGITKSDSDDEKCSVIHNSLYDNKLASAKHLDTLAPVADALGMEYKLTPGLSPQQLNVIVEGITDQIYLNAMAAVLNVDISGISIIPSTGAQNIKHLCGILIGWGFRFLAVFDYDNEGLRCGHELSEELNLQYGKAFILLKELHDDEFIKENKIEETQSVSMESMFSKADKQKYCLDKQYESQKKIRAVQFASAIADGGTVDDETKRNFIMLFERIKKKAQ